MPACTLSPAIQPEGLIQIRRGYATDCRGLRLSVEIDTEGWTARVAGGGRTLYSARRYSQEAAKIAAAEFAWLSMGAAGSNSPEAMARHLSWREYWQA
jgi:hypothetical protein